MSNGGYPQPGQQQNPNSAPLGFGVSSPTSTDGFGYPPNTTNYSINHGSQPYHQPTSPSAPPIYPQLSSHMKEEQQMPTVNPYSYKPGNDAHLNSGSTENSHTPYPQGSMGLIPPGSAELYTSPAPVKLFFVQKDGHVTSPKEDVVFKIFKLHSPTQTPMRQASFSGSINNAEYLLVANSIWSLGVSKGRNYCIKGATAGIYGFHDTSTTPPRCVVIKLTPTNASESQRFDVLMNAAILMIDEPTSAVDKVENGIEGAYQTVTRSMNSFVKDSAPDVHKKTKWFRKGASTVLTTGSKLISQGTHLVSDPLLGKSTKGIGAEHHEILTAFKSYQHAAYKNEITIVTTQT